MAFLSLPDYLTDLIICLILLVGICIGFLFRSKYVFINCFVSGGLLIISFFAAYPYLKNFFDNQLLVMVTGSSSQEIAGFEVDTSSLQSAMGSLYDMLNVFSFYFNDGFGVSKAEFVANIETISSGLSMLIIFVAVIILSLILTSITMLFLKVFKVADKNKKKKKDFIVLGGTLNAFYVVGIVVVVVYYVYSISSGLQEFTYIADGVEAKLDNINSLSGDIENLMGTINQFKTTFSSYITEDLDDQLNTITNLLQSARDLINDYTSKDADLYQAIAQLNSNLENFRNLVTSYIQPLRYNEILKNNNIGLLDVRVENTEPLTLAQSINKIITGFKSMVLNTVDDVVENAHGLIDTTNDFLKDIYDQFVAMGF